MPDIPQNIKSLLNRIDSVATRHGRNAKEVTLLAVSKTQSASAVREAYASGLRAFGENYLQEAENKMALLSDLDIEWHFIGPIQSNKTRAIATRFHWVHSVDRFKIAKRLSEQRPSALPALNLCLQVNIDREPSKSGVDPEEVADLARLIYDLPRVRLRGLMAIPEASEDGGKQRSAFFRLRQLLDTLRALSPQPEALDTLSMGMSGDMEAAIAEGATIIRIGTAIFGKRH